MSFVNALRMRNLFPVNSGLGTAKIDLSGPDPMYEIIDAVNRQRQIQQPNIQIQQQQQQRTVDPFDPVGMGSRLKFGGVTGGSSNPGADILERSKRSAEQTYAKYPTQFSQPTAQGPSNDQQHLEDYFRRKNEETKANATMEAAKARTIKAGDTDYEKGWEITNTIDPTTGEQSTWRVNKYDGSKERVSGIGGVKSTPESAANVAKQIAADAQVEENKKGIASRTEDLMRTVRDLYDPQNDALTPQGAVSTGGTAVGNYLPWTEGWAGHDKITAIKSTNVLNLINELKEKSKTGALGMGTLSNKDLGVLQKAADLLSPWTSEGEFKKQIGIVYRELEDVLKRANEPITRKTRTFDQTAPEERPEANAGMDSANPYVVPQGRIRVRNKVTGQTGTISAGAFDVNKYEAIK